MQVDPLRQPDLPHIDEGRPGQIRASLHLEYIEHADLPTFVSHSGDTQGFLVLFHRTFKQLLALAQQLFGGEVSLVLLTATSALCPYAANACS